MPVKKGTVPESRNPLQNKISGRVVTERPSPPKNGNCVGKPTYWWYGNEKRPGRDFSEAVRLCATCPIKYECLAYSLEWEEFGIWGGLTEYQRSQLRTALGLNKKYLDDSKRRFYQDQSVRLAKKKMALRRITASPW